MMDGWHSHNGTAASERALHFVFIGKSIASGWNNPAATSHRSFLTALGERGHQARFLEMRLNEAVMGLLERRGASALKAFDSAYPSIAYRTYDLPPMRELDVWLGREAATADVLVVLEGAPDVVAEGLARLDAAHVLRLREERADEEHRGWHSILTAIDVEARMPYAPVLPNVTSIGAAKYIDTLLITFGDEPLTRAVAERLPNATRLAAGDVTPDGFESIQDLDLAQWYARSDTVVVVDPLAERDGASRAALPAAYGARCILVANDETGSFSGPVTHMPLAEIAPGIPSIQGRVVPDIGPWLASERANDLEAIVSRYHAQRLGRRL
jgi:hypothetical protein